MTVLTIIRGLPGSGKSTIAQKIADEAWDYEKGYGPDLWEADDFFTNTYTGEYRFDASLLSEAHSWCYVSTLKSLRDGVDAIVSNTFTQVWEMTRYLELTKKVPGLQIRIIEVKTQYASIHGVPEAKIAQMKARWEASPTGFDLEVIE